MLWSESVVECDFEGFETIPVEPLVNEIVSLAKIMRLEMDSKDIDELVKEPSKELISLQNPVKVKPWTKTLWNVQHGNICPQIVNAPNYEGDEDCLTLNVYLPKNICNSTNRCPVIVVVHVFGLYRGNGNSDFYGADRFVKEDVIMVVPNYRLEAFGFSNTEDQNIQGNFGLMDQLMALIWIQDNIAAFGGERAQVTLSGDGASLCYHCAAEFARGLFSSIILQSTSCLSGWNFQAKPRQALEELAAGLNLTYTGMPDLAEKLRNAPVRDILLVAANMRAKSQAVIRHRKSFPFAPAVDANMPRLVPTRPIDFMNIILESNEHEICHGVKVITGSISLEGGIGKLDLLGTPNLLENIQNDKELLVPPVCINATKGSSESIAIGNKLFTYYFSNGTSDIQFYRYKTMLHSMNGNIAFARYNFLNKIPPYLYIYKFCSQTNYMRRALLPEYACSDTVGPISTDDQPLIYYQTEISSFVKAYSNNVTLIYYNDRTEADNRLSAQMIRFFVNFARTGNPNGCGPLDPLLGIEWKPVSDFTNLQPMYFDSTLKMDRHSYQNDINFWETLCTV